MIRLVEDLLTPEELKAIELVSNSDSPRFDILVNLSGLDPKQDFKHTDLRRLNMCGANLRGFDFTGSDLRYCAKNANTQVDDTTVFVNALTEWIEIDALPIVMKMQEVEIVSGSEKRTAVLDELVGEFGMSHHVVTYMVAAASNADSLDEFIDFAMFLPPNLSEEQAVKMRQAAAKLLKKKLARSKSRTRRDKTAIFALENIADRLKVSKGTLAARIYSNLAEIVNSKNQADQFSKTATIERADMERAFAKLGD